MYTTDYTPYMLAGAFVALLPFLWFLSMEIEESVPKESAAKESVEQSSDSSDSSDSSESDSSESTESLHPLGPLLTYLVSDLEMVILQLLDKLGEMTTRDILYEFSDIPEWIHTDRSDLNRCLYRMHDECIICMRKDNGKPVWSIPA